MFIPYRAVNKMLPGYKRNCLMLYREIIAFCSWIHKKQEKTLGGQKVELFNIKFGGTYSDHCAVHIVTTVR